MDSQGLGGASPDLSTRCCDPPNWKCGSNRPQEQPQRSLSRTAKIQSRTIKLPGSGTGSELEVKLQPPMWEKLDEAEFV